MHYSSDDLVVVKFSRDAETPKKNERSSDKIRTKNKNKKKVPKSFFWRHVVEFFRTTGLHGYKYIVMEDTPFLERFFWGILTAVSLIIAITLVWIAWDFTSSSVTVIVIESTHYQTWNYPFPAVTICSLNKVSREKATMLTKKLNIPNSQNVTRDDVFGLLKYTPILLGNIPVSKDVKNEITILQAVLDYNNITAIKLLKKLTPTCVDLTEKCWWKDHVYRCDTIFQEVNTSEGLCCAFNFHGKKIPTTSVKQNPLQFKNPRRVAGCGHSSALSVLLKIDVDDYYSSVFGTYGIRIYIHDPYNFADESATPKVIGPTVEAFMEIDSETTYVTEEIVNMPTEIRKCIIGPEIPSKSFSLYTYTNCLAECRSMIVLNRCGCVPVFLPYLDKQRMCNFSDAQCVYKARAFYGKSLPDTNITCNCLPNCELQSYQEEISTGMFAKIAPVHAEEEINTEIKSNESLVHVYFNDLMGTRYRMDGSSKWYNLLASFGGLLSLFLGFSIVSGFELIYFFTVRFFFDMLQKDRIVNNPKDESDNPDNRTNNQLFNRWVEKHHIVPSNESRNNRKDEFKQDRQRF